MSNPIPAVAVIVITMTFTSLMFGQEIAELSFTGFSQPRGEVEEPEGVLEATAAAIRSVGNFFKDLFAGMWGAAKFFVNLMTFNVPGAPMFVRVLVTGVNGGSILWAVAGLFRGGK